MEDAKKNDTAEFVRKPINMRDLKEQYYGSFRRGFEVEKIAELSREQFERFSGEGKKRGLLYVVIRDRKNPSQCEIMVFADDAAKVNRVMDKMNLDFLKSESGEAVQEVVMEADRKKWI